LIRMHNESTRKYLPNWEVFCCRWTKMVLYYRHRQRQSDHFSGFADSSYSSSSRAWL